MMAEFKPIVPQYTVSHNNTTTFVRHTDTKTRKEVIELINKTTMSDALTERDFVKHIESKITKELSGGDGVLDVMRCDKISLHNKYRWVFSIQVLLKHKLILQNDTTGIHIVEINKGAPLFSGRMCDAQACLETDHITCCPGCNQRYFCSGQCYFNDWDTHSKLCIQSQRFDYDMANINKK